RGCIHLRQGLRSLLFTRWLRYMIYGNALMHPRPCQLFVLVVAAILFGRVDPVEADSPGAPPPIGLVRFDENYLYLRNGDSSQLKALSPWTPVKYIPLNEHGDIYLTLGTEVRLR